MLKRKITIKDRVLRKEHRSGWEYALAALDPLNTEKGILVDTFIESTFDWEVGRKQRERVLPYTEPWIGFLHNPVGIPEWHDYRSAPQVIFTQPTWKESIKNCKGIITFSRHMKAWLSSQLKVPILNLHHPTEIPIQRFTMERFLSNDLPLIVHVGWWLRRIHSIYQLPVTTLQKAILQPVAGRKLNDFHRVVAREAQNLDLWNVDRRTTLEIHYQSNSQFDRLLSENIVFIHLYDSVTNNTLIECIARNTPILINKLPSVVEHLGESYPFYFDTLEEAAEKAEDTDQIAAAHKYLCGMSKENLEADFFCRTFAESDLYHDL